MYKHADTYTYLDGSNGLCVPHVQLLLVSQQHHLKRLHVQIELIVQKLHVVLISLSRYGSWDLRLLLLLLLLLSAARFVLKIAFD